MLSIGGVDGCPNGWICVEQAADGTLTADVYPDAAALFARARVLDVLTIDIPIGLMEAGSRACDIAARRLLHGRASSVFPAPVRAALAATTYREACALSEAACGKRLSQQAFAILPRIRQVDLLLRADAALRGRVREVHPEVCFAVWNGGSPMANAKRTPDGHAQRRSLVEGTFGPTAVHAVRARFGRGAVADDDILDAFAALWTAGRVQRGEARTVPEQPPMDAYGLPTEMVV